MNRAGPKSPPTWRSRSNVERQKRNTTHNEEHGVIERDTCKAKQKRRAWPGGLEGVGQVEVGGDLTWVVEADLIDKGTSEWRTRGRSERQLCGGGAGGGEGRGSLAEGMQRSL